MPVDYRKQYRSDQLEPMWPNAAIRGTVAALCTLAVLTVLAVLPVILEQWGLGHWTHESTPADPRITPIHIRPEWYFLACFQWLKLFPSEFVGVSGNTAGVLTQGLFIVAACILPYIVRRKAPESRGLLHGAVVTVVILVFLAFTFWGTWPPPPLLIISICAATVIFYVLLAGERGRIRSISKESKDHSA